MPITRTPMIDDDGTGTTGTIINNAWKQEFYNQIDGLAASPAQAWTPADVSGAGLVLVTAVGWFVLTGPMVNWWAWVIYPATSDGSNAVIGGLPLLSDKIHAGGTLSAGPDVRIFHPQNSVVLEIRTSASAPMPNSALSGAQLIFQGSYIKL